MLTLLLEEAVTEAGLHGGSSASISGGLGSVGVYDRDGECHPCHLQMPGGAIPARTYRLSTFVGLKHPCFLSASTRRNKMKVKNSLLLY